MRLLIAALCLPLSLAFASAGGASPPCQGVMNQSGCKPAPWNGQLQQTWNTPGYYGGWTTGPVQCDPFTTRCKGWVQP